MDFELALGWFFLWNFSFLVFILFHNFDFGKMFLKNVEVKKSRIVIMEQFNFTVIPPGLWPAETILIFRAIQNSNPF